MPNTQHQLFHPEEGETIIEPPGRGDGWWAGAPGAFVDPEDGDIYLTYRLRRPRGVTPDRGGICLLGQSSDGVHFRTIWSMEKASLNSPSLERSDITRRSDGTWILYLSYVDGETNQWRTDLIRADQAAGFDPRAREKLFLPEDIGMAAVKDPVLLQAGAESFLFLSCAAPRSTGVPVDHRTGDAYDTGTILSHTGLATSRNGVDFTWQGLVLEAQDDGAWDGYSARIASVLPLERDAAAFDYPLHPAPYSLSSAWLALYDGAYGVENHYDETTGLALSTNLKEWKRLTVSTPALTAPEGRCLRYLDVVRRGDELFFYYEYGRPDGSHELRLNRAPVSILDTLELRL